MPHTNIIIIFNKKGHNMKKIILLTLLLITFASVQSQKIFKDKKTNRQMVLLPNGKVIPLTQYNKSYDSVLKLSGQISVPVLTPTPTYVPTTAGATRSTTSTNPTLTLNINYPKFSWSLTPSAISGTSTFEFIILTDNLEIVHHIKLNDTSYTLTLPPATYVCMIKYKNKTTLSKYQEFTVK